MDDFLIGAEYADRNGAQAAGEAYVIFGRRDGATPWGDLAQLDGSNGFILQGVHRYERIGEGFAGGKDLTGDGIDDLMLSFRSYDTASPIVSGRIVVLPGSNTGFDRVITPSTLPVQPGLGLDFAGLDFFLPEPAILAGDVNGDGFQDVLTILSDPSYDNIEVRLLPGTADGLPVSVDDPGGIRVTNTRSLAIFDNVSPIGDVNGDGLDDFAIGIPHFASHSPGDDPRIARVAVVFGDRSGKTVDVSDLNGASGFRLDGTPGTLGLVGIGQVPVGDVNGDGIDDFIVAGIDDRAYVIFGATTGFAETISVSTLDPTNGVTLVGVPGSYAGFRVSGAGDVNGDGAPDMIVGALRFESGASSDPGGAYLVFGSATGFGAQIDLTTLDGTNGFRMWGEANGDRAGDFVAAAGDVNGDGFDDLLVGATYADSNGLLNSNGRSYLLYGGPTLRDLDRLDGQMDGRIALANAAALLVGVTDGADVLVGGPFGDRIHGITGDDTIRGGTGADTIDGGQGADWLIGQDGGDLLIVDDVGDRIGESRHWAGRDTVEASIDFAMGRQHIEDLTLTGTAVSGTGNGLRNVLTGNAGDNVLDGGRNNDTLYGGVGDDTYLLRAPGDLAVETHYSNGGYDTVLAFGSFRFDRQNVDGIRLDTGSIEEIHLQNMRNKAGDLVQGLTILGSWNSEKIVGNDADNNLNGQGGRDVITGGAGADSFIFTNWLYPESYGLEGQITDFDADEDMIVIWQNILAGFDQRGQLDPAAFHIGSAATTAAHRFIYDQGTLLFDPDGSGRAEALAVVDLLGTPDLSADDIVIR